MTYSKLDTVMQTVASMDIFEIDAFINTFAVGLGFANLVETLKPYQGQDDGNMILTPVTKNANTYALFILPNPKFIQSIKLLRHMTGMGLKDAKDAIDLMKLNGKPIEVICNAPFAIMQDFVVMANAEDVAYQVLENV